MEKEQVTREDLNRKYTLDLALNVEVLKDMLLKVSKYGLLHSESCSWVKTRKLVYGKLECDCKAKETKKDLDKLVKELK